ncbi:MAG: PVC-type heme-binding CxxCH protein [Gemmataceae bacterium]
MRPLALLGLLLSLALGLSLADGPAATETVKLNGHTFTVPAGFTIELAVKPGLVERPITVDLDEQGRLYVADSSGSNAKVELQLKERPHRIVRLEDTDGDGVYDRATVFADKMMFPEGTLWHDGSLYVAAPPSIWKLTDTDGDGVADQRVEWFQGKTLTGCANDLHGPYLGLDGRIYWAKGAFAKQSYKRSDGSEWGTRAAHIFRARADGTDVEPVMTGGMDNPVDVAFTPTGERVFTTTFFQHPAGGRRDGLVHAVDGGVYGKDHTPVYEHPWTSPQLMPVLTHMGPAAPAGLTRYESSVFGPGYQDSLFATQFNLQKVSRHVLTPSGATFVTADSDFVVSDNRDFHPTDVMEDADGSLLVIDTGGWYKLCCPSSQLVKADIHGAIYRVRKKERGEGRRPARAGTRLGERVGEAARRHPSGGRPAGHAPARQERRRGPAGTGEGPPAERRLDRHPHRRPRSEGVRPQTAVRRGRRRPPGGSTLRQPVARQGRAVAGRGAAQPRLATGPPRPPPRRLGRLGDADAVPALLAALRRPSDRFLEHSLTFALIEIANPEATAKGLSDSWPGARRAALIAAGPDARRQARRRHGRANRSPRPTPL